MKKILLAGLIVFMTVCVMAQIQQRATRYPQGFRKAEVPAAIRNRATLQHRADPSMDNGSPTNNLQSRAWLAPLSPRALTTVQCEEIIGYTYYDSQTNGTISNRIVNNLDGTLSAAWTFSPNATSGFPQRGSGYDYYDGNQWIFSNTLANIPNVAIGVRSGFTNIAVTSSGREMLIAHGSTVGHMLQVDRPVKGTGAWTSQTNLLGSGTNDDTWAKAIATNDTVYAIWQGTGTSGTKLFGQDGPILFSRSIDGGVTWPILRAQIPLLDSNYYIGFGGDSYSIDARAGVVAIAFGEPTTDVGIVKSTDGGQTWTKTIIQHFPIPFFSADSMFTYLHGIGTPVDTMDGTMGDAHVLIDNNGMCHVFWSQMIWWRDSTVTTAGSYFFRPYQSDKLYYWNETMASDSFVTIASSQDYNGNDTLDFASPLDTTCNLLGEYRGGMTQMPSAGIDAGGTIYLAYQTVCEGCDTNAYHQLHKHVYMMTSPDHGQTWTYPYDIVPSVAQGGDGENQEAVFACIAKNVDNNAYIIYQRDPAPGTALNTANACEAANNNGASDIIAACIEAATVGTNTVHSNEVLVSQNYPNPAHSYTAINIVLKKTSDIGIQISDLLGNLVYTDHQINAAAGNHTLTLNTAAWSKGIYFYTIRSGGINVSKKMIIQ